MIVITVARRPLNGTVSATIALYGTGGINIDACRIGSSGGTAREGKADQPTGQGWANMVGHGVRELGAGRWPSNLILQHTNTCVHVGEAQEHMKQMGPLSGNFNTSSGVVHSVYQGLQKAPTVTDLWECAPGCPVHLLGEQSGDRPVSGAAKKGSSSRYDRDGSARGMFGVSGGDPGKMPSDEGTASRFFKQVQK